MKVFGTGHRPEDCDMDMLEVTRRIEDYLRTHAVEVAICGMAAGFDLTWGATALDCGVPVWSVRPWAGHRPRVADRQQYDWIESQAERHFITNDSLSYPGPWVYQKRNEQMVDMGDEGVALWNGKDSGGTFNCLTYAWGKKVDVTNLYEAA